MHKIPIQQNEEHFSRRSRSFSILHANLKGTSEQEVPANREALSSNDTSQNIDPQTLAKLSKGKLKVEDQGCGEYTVTHAFHIGKLPTSPKSYGLQTSCISNTKLSFNIILPPLSQIGETITKKKMKKMHPSRFTKMSKMFHV